MPHGLGHTVGLEVHDLQPLGWIVQENDVLTVEPGIYFNLDVFADARRDIVQRDLINWPRVELAFATHLGGVRIEDVILVTADGHEVLSEDAPKEVADIEKLLKKKATHQV
jgi:Xaa-Pro aminopeptidase